MQGEAEGIELSGDASPHPAGPRESVQRDDILHAADHTLLACTCFCAPSPTSSLAAVCGLPAHRPARVPRRSMLALTRQHGIEASPHIDERSAAFFALGQAKATGRPTAVACTSGTALAHYAPAVIEAFEARVPMLILTADRPPELREVGAGQTIDQVKLFGGAVKWFFDVGDHEPTPERLRWMRTLACRAYWTTVTGRPGPVHLNFALREPLVPPAETEWDRADLSARPDGSPFVTRIAPSAQLAPEAMTAVAEIVAATPRGVVVAGREERSADLPGAVAAFAEAAGYPVLADPLGGARAGAAAIAHYDALLRDEQFATAQLPELVIRVGDLPTSPSLRRWLASLGAHPGRNRPGWRLAGPGRCRRPFARARSGDDADGARSARPCRRSCDDMARAVARG